MGAYSSNLCLKSINEVVGYKWEALYASGMASTLTLGESTPDSFTIKSLSDVHNGAFCI
jgi:hypothetical protein